MSQVRRQATAATGGPPLAGQSPPLTVSTTSQALSMNSDEAHADSGCASEWSKRLRRTPPTSYAVSDRIGSHAGSLPPSPASSTGASPPSSPAINKLEQLTCSCGLDIQQDDGNFDCNNNNNNIMHTVHVQQAKVATRATSASKANLMSSKQDNNRNNNNNNTRPGKHVVVQTLGLAEQNRGLTRNICRKHMPWFGIDVGGSLVKVVFFDPKEATAEELTTLQRIRQYLWSSKAYGATGTRDAHLEMPNCLINSRLGSLHFLRFATSEMPEFLAMAKRKGFAETVNRTICATGGGACKFEREIKDELGIRLHKTDEFDSIIHGIPYIDRFNSERECYFLEDPLDENKCTKVAYDFRQPYPYLVVNIGSGVSILAVYSKDRYSRISGSSLGGGTFLGLCCLLTQCKTFDEAIRLAKAGSSTKVDKLVKDIYGGDYAKFELSGDTVASAFGHMNLASHRKQIKKEDLARALLEMVTNNIGSLARMCAVNHSIDRVVFIGNFLRANQLSMKLLSFAVNYWSKGSIKALFLEHEGYFGAVGCFVESTQGITLNLTNEILA